MPTHLLLTTGDSRDQARTRVRHFFEKNFLVRYDRVVIPDSRIIAGDHADFWPRIEDGLAAIRKVVAENLAELRGGGFRKLEDLAGMKQGYESKVLHLVTHLLDGFFGIDSRFYNLEEDAHMISDRLALAIRGNPRGFYLVEAECDAFDDNGGDRLDLIRQFKVTPS